jgi:precorrin-6B methylase 2
VHPEHAAVMNPILQQLHSESVLWDIGAGIGA